MSILEDFLRDSNAARTQDEVYDIFSKAVRKLGFDQEAYVLLKQYRRSSEDDPHAIRLFTMPEDLEDYYVSNNMEDVNYLHKAAFRQSKTQPWYDKSVKDNRGFAEFEKMLYTSGLTSGICMPIYGQGMERAVVTFGKYHGGTKYDEESEQMLRIMSYHLHDRLKALSDTKADEINLSSREKEVLQWIMVGKSVSVIGDIMGISDHTVSTYLRRCYAKLNVSNQVAAVVKSLSLGLICP